jgi:hypothetical protein
MAKGLYSLKIWMFGKQLNLTAKQSDEFFKVCVFVSSFYIKHWYTCPSAVSAPAADLELLKALSERTEKHLQAAFRKLCNHLWYLSETLVCFSLFDDKVPIDEKRDLVKAFQATPLTDDISPRAQLPPNVPVKSLKLANFASSNSLRFFQITNLPRSFLDKDIEQWPQDIEYQKCSKVVQHIRVVNDTAERGVSLITTFLKNNKLTNDEIQRQYLLLVVDKHRKMFDKYGKEKY